MWTYEITYPFAVLAYWFLRGWSWISFFSGIVFGIGGLWLLAKLLYR